jgi:hypothetical protein
VGRPYIASLWLGSLRSGLRLKGFERRHLALFCMCCQTSFEFLFQRVCLVLTRPFPCLKGVNAIQSISALYLIDPIQIIANINCGHYLLSLIKSLINDVGISILNRKFIICIIKKKFNIVNLQKYLKV